MGFEGLGRLLARVTEGGDPDRVLEECIREVIRVFGADRALIMLTDPAAPFHAQGRDHRLNAEQCEEISRTVVQKAIVTGKLYKWELSAMAAKTESIATYGITCAYATPLRGLKTNNVSGALYVDYRDPAPTAPDAAAFEIFEAIAALASIIFELRVRLNVAQEELRTTRSRIDRRDRLPSLEELLKYPGMRPLEADIRDAIESEVPVLIVGETGTGKTALATAIAEASGRLPAELFTLGGSDDLNTISSELFGHHRGAFSGAVTARTGLVELTNRGTLVFDEVLNLPLQAQRMFLEFVQFGRYRPLGHAERAPKYADVRLIFATNGDLEEAVRDGHFREDLYYRIKGKTLRIPPLRTRREDIPALALACLKRVDPTRGWDLTAAARKYLVSSEHPWPGNIRELEFLVIGARDRARRDSNSEGQIDARHLEAAAAQGAVPRDVPASRTTEPRLDTPSLRDQWHNGHAALESLERKLIEAAMTKHNGVVQKAAEELGIPRQTLHSKAQKLGIKGRD